jgi:hypothetical protein
VMKNDLDIGAMDWDCRLTTQKELCEKANQIDYGLRHKERHVTVWAYIWENFKKEFKINIKL